MGIAILFWISAIFTKSGSYTKDISIRLVTPDSLILVSDSTCDAAITLSGKGVDLAKIGRFDHSKPLEVFVGTDAAVLTSNEVKSCLAKKISNSKVKIVEVDFIPRALKLDKKISKTVPVKANVEVSFSKLHTFKRAINITPKTVKITGPKSYVQNVKEWRTVKRTYDNISKSIEEVIDLNKPKYEFIKLDHSEATIGISVEEVTEKKLTVPVKTLDKKFMNAKIVPRQVEITFLVGLSMFEYINEDSFSAVIDVEKDTIPNNNYPVTILKKPKFVKIQNISPRFIQVYNLDNR